MAAEVNTFIEVIGLSQSYDSVYEYLLSLQFIMVSSAIFNAVFIYGGLAVSNLKENQSFTLQTISLVLSYIFVFMLELIIYYVLALLVGPNVFVAITTIFYISRLVVAFGYSKYEKTMFSNFFHSIGFNVGNFAYKHLNLNSNVSNFNKNYKKRLKLKYFN